jgi:nucleotide-binding universal stress UspA family protein
MLRTILIGLDGSPGSLVATDLAIRWARRYDAMLVGLGVIDEPGIRQPLAVPAESGVYKQSTDENRVSETRHHVEQFLGQFSLRCAQAGVASKVLEKSGLPSDALMSEAQRFDLIVVPRDANFHFATQGRDDDTITAVLRGAGRPVVIVPPELPANHSVVVAYDGSPQAARTLQVFQTLALNGVEPVHVVTVGETRLPAAKCADRAVEFLRSHEVQSEPHIVISGDPPGKAILAEAARLGAGLVVMGACGQPRLREFFFGSATKHTLANSTIPLFLYH